MSAISVLADRYVESAVSLSPTSATFAGIAGHDHEMTDFSPQGEEGRNHLDQTTLAALAGSAVEDESDRILKELMESELRSSLELHDMGEPFRDLNALHGPIQEVRICFDLMPRAAEEDWTTIAARVTLVPEALASYRQTLQEGVGRGLTAARRQVAECARQADTWAGTAGGTSYFDTILEEYDSTGFSVPSLRSELDPGVSSATKAYADLSSFLRDFYLPRAVESDAAGAERYAAHSRQMNGADLDLLETYVWGWDQLGWVESEMAATAERILPGGGGPEAIQLLKTDPARCIVGLDNFILWNQDLLDRIVSELNGVHFDLPDQIKRVEALVPPPGGALAPYYTPPTEDLSRPGRIWFPPGDTERIPLWSEVTTVHHEGVPGHHFQVGTTAILTERLSRYQRKWAWSAAHGEGWALYAERLMGELGYLENPDYYMGMLSAQALRCVRVIIDIGMHLELPIPSDQGFHPGETWSASLGLEVMRARTMLQEDFLQSEVVRYLGLPSQAISYKVGERAWLEARDEAKRSQGPEFDLRAWHNRALSLGPMGLDQMRRELIRA